MHPNRYRRAVAVVAVGGFLLAAGALLWSDRTGALLGSLRDLVVDAGRAVERRYDVDVADRSDVPGTVDQIAHTVLWGTGMVIVGWALRRRVPIPLTAIFMVGVSMVFEFAQPVFTARRVVQPTDIVANVVGIACAAVALIAVLWAIRTTRGDDREYFDERAHW